MTTKKTAAKPLELVPNEPAPQTTALVAPASNAPADLMRAAAASGMDANAIRELMALQREWEANEARKAYVAAMADFKKDPPEILKRKKVSFGDTSYSHATLFDVTDAIIAGLAEVGISHKWDLEQPEGGNIIVTCILTHRLGHSERTTLRSVPDASGKKNAIQQVASTVTYLERYTLLAATGIATKDMDDDGRGATPIPRITEEQVARFNDWIAEIGCSKPAFLRFMQVETLEDIRAADFDKARKALELKEKEKREKGQTP